MTTSTAFEISRVIDAPRHLVFAAWTEPDRLARWFGPVGFDVTKYTLDLRSGGRYHYLIETPDGHQMWGKWDFREVVPPEKLSFVAAFSDAEGGFTTHPMSPTWPRETLTTVTFEEESPNKTLVRLHAVPINASTPEEETFANAHDSMSQGWGGTFERLEQYASELR